MRNHLFDLPRQKPLALGIAFVLSLATSAATAATHVVMNCLNGGTGSLRAVIGAATTNSGDTVDMSGLSCATISLTTGAITITKNSLILKGPGRDALTVKRDSAISNARIFKHTGTGTLTISGLTVSDGYYGGSATTTANGGCIYSAGAVKLTRARVSDCAVTAKSTAQGGGIFAKTALTMSYSSLLNNTAHVVGASILDTARGGGAQATTFTATGSAIVGNSVKGTATTAFGGGVLSNGGDFTLTASLVSGNHSDGNGGGIAAGPGLCHSCTAQARVYNSTITGNSAYLVGGVLIGDASKVINSTIAFNTASYSKTLVSGNLKVFAAGLVAYEAPIYLESTLLANNVADNPYGDSDFSVISVLAKPATVTTAANLIREDYGQAPAGNLQGSCPLLGALRDNGGNTKTLALMSNSPGINVGSNATGNFTYDQRLTPFARDVNGPDIGAYEIQPEIIFTANFEGCPPLTP